MKTVVGLIERSAQRYPGRPALYCGDAEQTFGELNRSINRTARALQQAGIVRGDKVGVFVPNRPEYLHGYFACLKIGAMAIPVNLALGTKELAQILEDGEPRAVLGVADSLEVIQEARRGAASVEKVLLLDDDRAGSEGVSGIAGLIERMPDGNLDLMLGPDDVASCHYTSGTTGLPKGIVLSHANFVSNVEALLKTRDDWDDRQVFGCPLPMFHGYSTTILMLFPFAMGSALALLPKFTPESCLEMVEQRGVTFFGGVPSMYSLLARVRNRKRFDLSRCRYWICGGAPLPVETLLAFERAFPGSVMYEGYGLIETSPVLTLNPLNDKRKPGSIGPTIDGVELRIVDDLGRELPAGQVGEVIARGPNIMQGYYRNPRATAEVIRDGWFHTGDLGHRGEDGFYYINGRKKELIIVSGENVYPREVESILLTHPDVADAAVVGVPDSLRGEVVKAFVVHRNGAPPTAKDLIRFCGQSLAGYKVPKRVEFIEQIPRNATGKVQKFKLVMA